MALEEKENCALGTEIFRAGQDTQDITVLCDRNVSGWVHRKQDRVTEEGQHQIPPAGLQAGENTQEEVRFLWIVLVKPGVDTPILHY